MKIKSLAAALTTAALLLTISAVARGDSITTNGVTVSTGNIPQADENVLFNLPGLISSGLMVQGSTNLTHTVVDFTSNVDLATPSSGQARVAAADKGVFDYLKINLDSAGTFETLIFNINAAEDTPVKFVATTLGGTATFDQFSVSENGNNFFTMTSPGTSLKSLEIYGPILGVEMSDVRQIRIGVTAVPLPAAAWSTLGLLGVLGLGRIIRRK